MGSNNYCFITDSLGLDAAVGQPEKNPISYIKLLEDEYEKIFGKRLTVTKDCFTGRTSKMLLKLQDKYEWSTFQKVFIQVGIVDCSPRVLTSFQRKLVGRIRPMSLRNWVTKIIRKFHARWFFKYFPYPVLVNLRDFKESLTHFVAHIKMSGNAEIYLISIAPTTDVKEFTYVGLTNKIVEYNEVIKQVTAVTGSHYIDLHNCILDKRNELVYDGVHLNHGGKIKLARLLLECISRNES